MRFFLHALLALALAGGVSACGVKSKLKTPSQMALEDQKKAKKDDDNTTDHTDSTSATDDTTQPATAQPAPAAPAVSPTVAPETK